MGNPWISDGLLPLLIYHLASQAIKMVSNGNPRRKEGKNVQISTATLEIPVETKCGSICVF